MTSFLPRPIFDLKANVKHVVRADETPSGIAEIYGGTYYELLAANLPRASRPTSLGGARTFDELVEGETLNLPAHWTLPKSVTEKYPALLGAAPVLDSTNPVYVAALDSAHKQLDSALSTASSAEAQAFLASVVNAAVQWYMTEGGGATGVDTTLMDKLVYSAALWTETFGSALPVDQTATFPWGPLGMMLGGFNQWDNANWPGSGQPGQGQGQIPPPSGYSAILNGPPNFPAGSDWSWVPWDVLGAYGPNLEALPSMDAVAVTASMDQAGVRQAFQDAITKALATVAPPGGCPDGYKNVDPADPTSQCVSICSDPAMWDPKRKMCCPTGSTYSATAPGGCDCGANVTYDPNTNTCGGAGSASTTTAPTGLSTGAKVGIATGLVIAGWGLWKYWPRKKGGSSTPMV